MAKVKNDVFDSNLVSTRSVVLNQNDRSVHYGDEFAGVVKLDAEGNYDCAVYIDRKKFEFGKANDIETGAQKVAQAYFDRVARGVDLFWDAEVRDDRRLCPSFEISVPLKVGNAHDPKLEFSSADLSAVAASIKPDVEIDIAEVMNLNIEDIVQIRARVIHKEGGRYGLQFLYLDL